MMNNTPVCTKFVLLVVAGLLAVVHSSISCPAKCICNSATQHVVCRDSEMTDIPKTIPSDTQFLSISGTDGSQLTKLTHLKKADFRHLRKLTDLYITHSNVRTIEEDTFQGMPLLRRIMISDNEIQRFPKGLFQNLPYLSNIDITGNSQCEIEHGVFTNILSLRYLYAGFVNIGSVKLDTFQGLSSLIGLHIPGNNLEEMDGDSLASLASLEVLDISNNDLTTLPRTLQPRLSTLKTIYLAENPWHCNCEMEWLKTVPAISLPVSPAAPLSADSLVMCFTPSRLVFRHLNEIPEEDLPCSKPAELDCGGNYTFTEGDYLSIRCDVSGDPEPTMVFNRPDKVAVDGKNPVRGYLVKGFTLTIPAASVKEEGEWVVVAENAKGQAETKVHVSMIRPLDPETSTQSEKTSTKRSVGHSTNVHVSMITLPGPETSTTSEKTSTKPSVGHSTNVHVSMITLPGPDTTAEPETSTEPPEGPSTVGPRRIIARRRGPAKGSVDDTGIIIAAVASTLAVIAAACLAACAIHRRYTSNRVQPFHEDETV